VPTIRRERKVRPAMRRGSVIILHCNEKRVVGHSCFAIVFPGTGLPHGMVFAVTERIAEGINKAETNHLLKKTSQKERA